MTVLERLRELDSTRREVLTVDEERIARDAVAAGKAWMGRAGVRPTCPWPVHG